MDLCDVLHRPGEAMHREENEPPRARGWQKWLWPFLACVMVGAFALRVYFKKYQSGLDGDTPRAELVAYVSTPRGQRALEQMLRSLASTRPPLLDRISGFMRRHAPDKLQPEEGMSEADEQVMNALRVLEKLPPEQKAPHIEIFVSMLDHPVHGAIASEELQEIGKIAPNSVAFLLARVKASVGNPTGIPDFEALQLALKIAPADPRVRQALLLLITNTPPLLMGREMAIEELARHYPNDPQTLQALERAAQDANSVVASTARSELSRLKARGASR